MANLPTLEVNAGKREVFKRNFLIIVGCARTNVIGSRSSLVIASVRSSIH